MTQRFLIEVKHSGQGASAGSSARGSSPAATLEREAKKAEQAAKRAADSQQREIRRAQQAQLRYAQLVETSQNRIGAAAAREARKAADAQIREAKRAADAEIREATRAAQARQRLLQRVSQAVARSGSTIGAGAAGAVRGVGGAIGGAASSIAQGGILGLAGTAPRAIGDLAGEGLKAAGSLVGALGKGVAQLLPGALGFIPNLIGSAFAVVGELAGGLSKAAGEIAGFIGDKLGLALKISLGVAVGIGLAGLRNALTKDELTPFFENFANAAGVTAKDALDKLRASTEGLVSDLDLMRAANRAWLSEAVETADQFNELASFADNVSDVIGGDAAGAIEFLTNALASLQSKGLKRVLGTTIDFEKAFKDAGIAARGLSAEQENAAKHAIAFELVIGKLHQRFDGLSKDGGQVKDAFDRVRASISNSLTSIGSSLLPLLNDVLKAVLPISKAIGTFFDNNNAAIADAIQTAVGKIGIDLADLPTLISNINLGEVFELAGVEADALWDLVSTGAVASAEFVKDHWLAIWRDIKAAALDAVSQDGSLLGGRANELRGEAKNLRERASNVFPRAFGERSDFAKRQAARDNRSAAISSQVLQRAATVPPSQLVNPRATPQASFSDTGSSNRSGANAQGGSEQTVNVNRAAAALAAEITKVTSFFALAASKAVDVKRRELAEVQRVFDLEREIGRVKADEAKAIKELSAREKEARAAIAAQFEADVARIKSDLEAGIQARKSAVSDELLGQVGGLGADESGIPAKFRRAAKKVRRVASRERRDSLNSLAGGLSVDELAANGGSLLQDVFAKQASKETAGPNALAAIEAQKQLAALTAQRVAQEEQLAAETVKQFNEIIKNTERSIQLHEQQIDTARAQGERIEKLEAELARLKKLAESVPGRPGR